MNPTVYYINSNESVIKMTQIDLKGRIIKRLE